MQDVNVLQGFASGSQWFSPGVQISLPSDAARALVSAGLAEFAGEPPAAPEPVAKPKPRAKSAD